MNRRADVFTHLFVSEGWPHMSAAPNNKQHPVQSAAAPSPFPPIADYAFLSNCHTGALVALTVESAGSAFPRSTHRVSSRASWTARPVSSVWTVRDQPSLLAQLRDRHERARDDVEDAGRLDRRQRRVDDGAAQARGRDHASHSPADRRRRRPHAGSDGRVPGGQRRGGADLRARVRLRPGSSDAGPRSFRCSAGGR